MLENMIHVWTTEIFSRNLLIELTTLKTQSTVNAHLLFSVYHKSRNLIKSPHTVRYFILRKETDQKY